MKKFTLIIACLLTTLSLTSCSSARWPGDHASIPSTGKQTTTSLNDSTLWKKSSNATWYSLQHTPLHTLQEARNANNDSLASGWLALAILSKQDSTNTQELVQGLIDWRNTYPSHPGNQLIPSESTLNALLTTPPPSHIAILLPLHGPMASSGQAVRSGFLSAYYSGNGQSSQKQAISFYDTSETTNIATLYQKAVEQGADLIIGPLIKNDVETLSRLSRFNVKVLALNYTTSSFFSSLPTNFYEFGLSPITETEQMTDKARQASLSRALVISSNDTWGHRVTDALTARWENAGGKINDTLYFTPHSNLTQDIATLLHINPKEDRELMREDNTKSILAEQRRQDFDVIFIFAQPEMARQIVPLLRFYYAGNVPVYSISAIYSGRVNPTKDKDLNGVTFCEIPWIIQASRSSSTQSSRLYAIGRDAYLLSLSIPRLNALPNFPIYGATGALDMEKQQIHQRLPWVTMHGGRI